LMSEKRSEIEKEFYDELAGDVEVSINEELLRTIQLPRGGEEMTPPPLPGK
jgi:hypothetical protein